MFGVPSFFGYNTTFVSVPIATAATGVSDSAFTANWDAFAGAQYYLLDVSLSSSFSSYVLQDQVVYTNSYNVTGLTSSTTYYYRVRASTSYNSDAQAFITATGITNTTEQQAINSLVISLQGYGLWTKMKAIYPMVGGTSTTHKYNLKDPRDLDAAFRLVFSGGWTHSSTGATPNGTNGYADTKLVPNSVLTAHNIHFSYYSRTQITSTSSCEIGSSNSGYINQYNMDMYYNGVSKKAFVAGSYPTNSVTSTNTDTLGFMIASRTANNSAKMFMDGSQVGSTLTATYEGGYSTSAIYLASLNNGGTIVEYSNKQTAFASIGDGLTDTEASNLYSAVNNFQVALSRNV